ncbi:type VI secretion system contractile sheath small subunit [Francisella sp. LA112445]|jgi:type VI secretion system protein ImpB|uniref:type VI secretion system contractile sheath small subunit n=1 Tax=Francisella sp. LA112445 TaxID=1395624 RepID=UPI001788C0B6|nr:type VI secretion system contractile sheath small subunit [Francisella sp. LA112445]QIW09703.1 type VI secretion system contractile sheath small subunit [Francisella sp. LA112445]
MKINQTIPKSRITITYDMEVDGVKKKKELPFRQLLVGDLSLGNSQERQKDLSNRKVYELASPNLSEVMKPMGIKLNISVPNHIKEGAEDIQVNLDVDSMKVFDPNTIAQRIPELASLLQAKALIQEFSSTIDNNRKLRNLLNNCINSSQALEKIQEELPLLESYKLNDQEKGV